ncbi:hypothetical protein K492DRAFT_238934 [Lichtheimia hyalospora FSU 10163]|nr:hypothetical protein K492DRAFT_238934 [Lichtheimia hyalospora FSU 10163]
MIQHLPPPPYLRKKPLPEIPQQEMPSYPVATSPPPPSMLPPDPYCCNGSMQSTLGLPSGLYRQPSRRHSFTDAKYYVNEDPIGKRLSMIIPSSESTKVEEEQQQQQPMMAGSSYTEEPESMHGPEERQPSPPPKKKKQPTPPTLEKPFDPSLSRPHHSPNTPDCLPSPVTPNQTKIPSPWGSMVSLVPDTPTTRQTTDSNMNSSTSSSLDQQQQQQHAITTATTTTKPTESTLVTQDTTTIEKDATTITQQPSQQPLAPIQTPEDILDPYKKPRFTCIASYSLTHNKDALRTYRRMATKTRSPQVQMAYAKYLLDVARLYVDGTTTTSLRQRILDEARYWISKLAKRLVPEALYIKGQWHLETHQVAKAMRYFEKAAKNGWMPAYIDLAEHADRQGDWHKAIAYYRSADGYADATYKMAMLLLKHNMDEGIRLLEKAANQQHSEKSGKAAFVLCNIYSYQVKTSAERNDVMAFRYLKQAVQAGLVGAVHRMGQVHTHGLLGQPQDPWQGYQCFVKAADDNHPKAMLDLANVYVQGIPSYLNPQPENAFRWCQRAADRGLKEAEYLLGTFYEDGIGVMVDYPRALEYFGKAASKGCTLAAEKLNQPVNQHHVSMRCHKPDVNNCTIM